MTTPIQPVPDVILASEFPSLADRPAGTYNAKAKAWADSENAMVTRARETALVTHNNALAAREAADEAVPAAATAVAARDKALEYRNSAQAAAAAAGSGAGLPSLVGNARKALVVGDDEDAVGWYDVTPTIGMRHVTAAATITAADQALMLRCTSTFTLSFEPLANLPAGWFCYLKNAGDGDITLDPTGSEQIDGRTSYIMYPGECRLIAHNGTEFVSVVLNGFYKVFTASGDFVKPPGYRLFEGLLWGGGGGGAKQSSTAQVVSGGTGAACAPFLFPNDALENSEPFTIGAGGAGGTGSPSNGGHGGDSTFKNVIAYKGTAGSQSAGGNVTQGGDAYKTIGLNPTFAGGGTSVSSTVMPGFYGGAAVNNTNASNTIYGGTSGGMITDNTPNNPSSSVFGSASAPMPSLTEGVDGIAPGGGGAPTRTGARAGNGARGELRIWGII